MVRLLAVAAIVMFVFVCVVLAHRVMSVDKLTRERDAARAKYVKYIRKAQSAARKNRAEAELYETMAEQFRKIALGETQPDPPQGQ